MTWLWLLSCLGWTGCHQPVFLQEYELVSNSMAPTIRGPYLPAVCSTCESIHPVAQETFSARLPCRCYACGGLCDVAQQPNPGDAVLIVPLTENGKRGPERFDLIAFHSPRDGRLQIKRVWGLPGEKVTIRNGQLWINDEPVPRTMQQRKNTYVTVAELPQPAHNRSHWFLRRGPATAVQNVTRPAVPSPPDVNPSLSPGDTIGWTHLRPAPVHPDEVSQTEWLVESELVDDYVCNQGLSYQTQTVNDYLVRVDFAPNSHGQLLIHTNVMHHPLSLEVAAYRLSTSVSDGDEVTTRLVYEPVPSGSQQAKPKKAGPGDVASARMEESVTSEPLPDMVCRHRLILAAHDGRLSLLVDDTTYTWALDSPQKMLDATPQKQPQVKLQCQSGQIHFSRLEVSRDIYLRTTHRDGAGEQHFGQLSDDAYFVLGDNQPASIDSRHFGAITHDQIVGKVSSGSRTGVISSILDEAP